MNRFFIIFFIALFFSTNASANTNNSFERVYLKYGISFEKPLGWNSIDSKKFRQLDNYTEIISGNGQANNEILAALNCYTGSKFASATFRISVRHKKTEVSQEDLSELKNEDFKYLLYEAINKSLDVDKKIGTKTNISTISVCTVKISELYSLFTRRDIFYDGKINKSGLFIIPINNAVIKINYSYDEHEEKLLKPIITRMLETVEIKKYNFK